MTIGARLSALWSTWQAVFWMALVIVLLAALNVWQWKRAIEAPLRAEIAGKDQALDDSEKLQADKDASAKRLQAVADQVAKQLTEGGSAYRKAMQAQPLTQQQCDPGQARMDAVNRAAGATTEK